MESSGKNEPVQFILKAVTQYKKLQEQNRLYHKKYYQTHKDYVNQKSREAYYNKYAIDPEFLARRSEYFKQRYLKRKALKLQTL